MIASLPMYDRPEIRGATDRLWQAIRENLGCGPEHLLRCGDPWDHWQAPDLLLSQTCGYPYRARLHGKVTLVGTPDYALESCDPGHYRSVFVARRNDFRTDPSEFADSVFAYNEPLSQSGWSAPATWAKAEGFGFRKTRCTGGHRASARAVAEGHADLTAIDALSWRLMHRYDAFASDLRVIASTPATPALPYITARTNDADAIFQACRVAIEQLASEDREALSIRTMTRIAPEAYLAVESPPPPPS